MEDERIHRKLERLKLSLETIVPSNKKIFLLDNANLSTGGDAQDVTDKIHETYKKMATQLAHDMGLRYSGVDIMTQSPIDKPIQEYTIIEINAAPGLDYYVEMGQKQESIVRNMYKKVLIAMTK